MGALLTRLNSAWSAARTAWEFGSRPASGQVVVTDPRLDSLRSALSDNLNFVSLRSKLRAAAAGELGQGLQLFDEMQQKDAVLHCVADVRRKALSGLGWQIVSAADVEDVGERNLADEAAAFVRETLGRLEEFDEALEHLASAVCSNLAVVELVWENLNLVDLVRVPSWRLRQDINEPGVVRVVAGDDAVGIPTNSAKWVTHVPDRSSGYPLSVSLLQAQSFVYLTKMLAIADWVVFCEVFGMPIRVARYQPGATPEEKTELGEMMEKLGSKAYGVFSQAVSLELVESSQRGTTPFKDLTEWCDRTQAKLFLAGNLVVDTTGGTGTHAAAAVQDEVRESLRDDDIKRESRTIRRQLIAPLCAFKFGGRDVPLPHFQREKPEVVDRMQEAQVIRLALEAGAPVPKGWALQRLDIPETQEGEETLESPDAFEAGVTETSY